MSTVVEVVHTNGGRATLEWPDRLRIPVRGEGFVIGKPDSLEEPEISGVIRQVEWVVSDNGGHGYSYWVELEVTSNEPL